ncbi:hypothetical protein MVEN_00665500 [Mycena venus]|uniref:Uncharacterized protein n=1 Tax=Mycena venus TaxID=2733690 RepID=A0A8H7D6F0_9AGAR|nr:hypothetical protein MVEN_00665500 [Mycena venus]
MPHMSRETLHDAEDSDLCASEAGRHYSDQVVHLATSTEPAQPAVTVDTQQIPLATSLVLSISSLEESNPSIQRIPVEPSTSITVLFWICTHWREMALSFPMLWSSLAMEPLHPFDEGGYPSSIFRYSFVLTETFFSDVQIPPHVPRGLSIQVENLHTPKISTVPQLFKRLLLPSLHNLTVLEIHSDAMDLTVLPSFLERPQCSLERIFHFVGRVATQLSNGVETLAVSARGKLLMPRLAKLDLPSCYSFDGTFGAIVASRFSSSVDGSSPPRGALKPIKVRFDPGPHPLN